jgi:hypothetical protein
MTFEQFISYLRDELNWPINRDSFEEIDDLFFDFSPEELGIDAKNAPKIKEIKRLRPLSSSQPWGIFFVKFERKRLPVMALRCILAKVAKKNRASANKADRAAWAANDLLFVSNYGEDNAQQISLAHFSEAEGSNDLPVLKVIGWDESDAELHRRHTENTLSDKLAWPSDPDDLNRWREQWSSAFTLRHREVITTAEDLAQRLAALANNIRESVKQALAIESSKGPITQLMNAFKDALIHDLDADGFADTYAQTIAYGLLSARMVDPSKKTADDMLGNLRTSPFLKEMLETFLSVGGRKGKAGKSGIDFDVLGIRDVTELLDRANMEAVLRNFGDRNRREDPVMHFFEGFLQAYDKKIRQDRGVFYTPQPVVSYIVRSVHELLQSEFHLEDGLADTTTWGEMIKKHPSFKLPPLTDEENCKETINPDEPFVQILDPATGTATFLVEAIAVIHRTLVDKWTKQRLSEKAQKTAWNEYVPKHLLPRLHAYELMMAPYAIAHMKVGLKLIETGFDAWETLGPNDRARIYLTNALEPWVKQLPLIGFDALAHEAAAVNEIKRHKRFTVVIGNPPYAGLSANLTEQARQLVSRFKFIDGARINERGALQLEKNLQDDYIKFLAFAEDRLKDSATGICGMICNHGFIDNPTLRGVRWSLLSSFRRIWTLDLHGNVNRGERTPDGADDQNVFDIKDAGVAIFLGVKGHREVATDNRISKSDLWGDREANKYPFLRTNTCSSHPWESVASEPEFFLFRTLARDGAVEYNTWPKVTEVFPLHSIGMITARDSYVMDFTVEPIVERAKAFRDSRLDDEATCRALGIPIKKGWNITRARERIRPVKDLAAHVRPVLYRPFDVRPVFYHESLIWGMAWPVMQHMIGGKNLALITSRMTKGETFQHLLVSNTLSEVILLSSKTSNNAFAFPLHLRSNSADLQFGARTNLAPQFLSSLANGLGLARDKTTGLPAGLTPEDIFHYVYAVFHSPGYRSRYAEFLKIDFPRLPLTGNLELFRALARLGGELTALHLLESPKLNKPRTKFIGNSREVEKVGWADDTVWINAGGKKAATTAGTSGFQGVPEAVWNFHIGGYQVCEKWLKDRKGRTLTDEDIAHYHKIVIALSETIRLMAEIDQVINKHGGWPGAFTKK